MVALNQLASAPVAPRGPERRRTHARRLASAVLAAALALAITVAPLLACDVTVSPASRTGFVGDSIDVVVVVQQTHRVCSVPIEATEIRVSGLQVESETAWVAVSSMSYQKELTVRLLEPGEGRVEVIRVCAKGGDRVSAAIAIAAATPAAVGATPSVEQSAATLPHEVTEAPSPVESEVAPAPPVPASTAAETTTPAASEWDTLRLPYIIVLLLLLAAGTFFVSRGSRRMRPFALLLSLGFLGFYVGGCPCPIGSLQNVYLHAGDVAGHLTTFVQFGAVVLVTLLFGRVFCGWACPLGATQYFLFRRDRDRKSRQDAMPPEYHRVLRWSKYGVLLALMLLVVLTGRPVFQDIDPFRVLFNLDFRWGLPLAFLVLVLAASVVIGFPFCKYACPLGALLGLLQRISLFKLRFNSSCTNCGLCSSVACDHSAIVRGSTCPSIDQQECVRCGECLSRCPAGAIAFRAGR